MTFNEYKSWLDGFSEGINGAPTKEQWEKIKSKLNEVVEHSTTIYHPGVPPVIAAPSQWLKPPYDIICGGGSGKITGFTPARMATEQEMAFIADTTFNN